MPVLFWWRAAPSNTGSLMSLRVEATYQFVMGNLLGIRSNVTMGGTFDGYDNCMEYVINNTAFTGSTDTSAMLAGYPPFMDTNCVTGTVTTGGWGTVSDIALQVLGSCDSHGGEELGSGEGALPVTLFRHHPAGFSLGSPAGWRTS